MSYSTWSRYHVPRTKKDLIREIKPLWNGRVSELYGKEIKELKGIFCSMRETKLRELMRK